MRTQNIQKSAKNKLVVDFDEDDFDSQSHGQGNPIQYDQLSSSDAHQNFKLNSQEERQLDVLFGGGENARENTIKRFDLSNQKTRNDRRRGSFEIGEQPEAHHSNQRDQRESEEMQIERRFQLATEGTKMPPAPKSKVEQKFAFGAMSDSEEE